METGMSKREEGIFHRTRLLVGERVMREMLTRRVIIVGVGGVGSWCAESLVRTGIRRLTIVDSDRVCLSNVNRQLMATSETVGEVKVEALRRRLLAINPEAEITAVQEVFTAETAENFSLQDYDYIIDAIDSLRDKVLLIRMATATKSGFFSSMGAALKMDPARIAVAEFWKVKGCPLAAALRRKFKQSKSLPRRKFKCVYSEELLPNLGAGLAGLPEDLPASNGGELPGNPALAHHDWTVTKAQVNGTVAHTTAIFGFTLAGLVVQDIYRKAISEEDTSV